MLWQCLVIEAVCGLRVQKKFVLAGRKQEMFFLGCSHEDSHLSKLDSLLWRTKRKHSFAWAVISHPLSARCFSYVWGKLYGNQVSLGLSCKGRCECSRGSSISAGFQIAGSVALARAAGLCRAWTPPLHTWEPSNELPYSQGFLYSRYLAKSELRGMYTCTIHSYPTKNKVWWASQPHYKAHKNSWLRMGWVGSIALQTCPACLKPLTSVRCGSQSEELNPSGHVGFNFLQVAYSCWGAKDSCVGAWRSEFLTFLFLDPHPSSVGSLQGSGKKFYAWRRLEN